MAKKSVFLTYILWLLGGFFGIHHFYLGRDIQAFLWWCTLGGYFGFGWLRDIVYIPAYVADANSEPEAVEKLKKFVRSYPKPPFSTARFTGMVVVGYLWGSVVSLAIPEDEVVGYSWKWLDIFVPLAIALGVWSVGNIGHETGTLWWSLFVSYCFYPFYYFYGGEYSFLSMIFMSATAFDCKSKRWKPRRDRKRGFIRRVSTLVVCGLLYTALWCSYVYFNATLQNSDGEDIPVHEAIHHFFRSPWWTDLKKSLSDTWTFLKTNGWMETWKLIVELSDPSGEQNAYKVLGLLHHANQTEINSVCRMLSVKWHPDKFKDPEEKITAQERFYEVQEACEILSKNKARRSRKNKKSDSEL